MSTVEVERIEVERRFTLTTEVRSVILALNRSVVTSLPRTDNYYDSPDYRLSARGWWLRKRNGNWNLWSLRLMLRRQKKRLLSLLENSASLKNMLSVK